MLSNQPLIDKQLSGIDRYLGIDVKKLYYPSPWLQILYDSLLLQTGLTIWWLGMTNQADELNIFIHRLMLCGLITLTLFVLFPAIGPLPHPEVDPAQQFYLNTFQSLREGKGLCDLSHSAGLITFPSFHVIWAILLVSACPRRLKPISVLVNSLVIVSAITSGWHYATDVLAGILITIFVIEVTDEYLNWHHEIREHYT